MEAGRQGRGDRVRKALWKKDTLLELTCVIGRQVMVDSWIKGTCKASLIFAILSSICFGFTLLFFCYFHKVEALLVGLRFVFLFNITNSYEFL
jgi:hypothetical protein